MSGARGIEILDAVVVGYDICCRIPVSIWPDPAALNRQVASTHALGGAFGAVAAAAAVMRIQKETVVAALSYCTQLASGQETWVRDSGHVQKAFVFGGLPAYQGLFALQLASMGWSGVREPFVGEPGFLAAFGSAPDVAALTDDLGRRFEIERTNIKRFPVGSSSQAPLSLLFAMLPQIRAEIRSVRVSISPSLARTVVGRDISNINIQYLLSIAAEDGELNFEAAHDEDRFREWSTHGSDFEVLVVADPALGTGRGATLTIQTADGRTYRDSMEHAPGTTANPLTPGQVEAKAKELMEPVLGPGQADEVISLVRDFDAASSDDVRGLIRLVRVVRPPGDGR